VGVVSACEVLGVARASYYRYQISTVGQHGNEEVIKKYIQNQGTDFDYQRLHKERLRDDWQLTLF
jgi:hypothetical protein